MKSNPCSLCPRHCATDRSSKPGFCRAGTQAVVAKIMMHRWEEPCISFKNGSGTIFFSGCSLQCVFCQNREISRGTQIGETYSAEQLADAFKNLEAQGAENINLVTPTHFVPTILNALNLYRPSIPIVYNSSGYETIETLRQLELYIDIYLMDFKYADAFLAQSYSNAADYPEIASAAILECLRQKPVPVLKNGKMLSGVIIRHLLLPMATKNAIQVTDWVAANARNAYFSLMSQFTPCGEHLPKNLQRKVTRREYEKVTNHIFELNLKNVYFQDFRSASTTYIPDFP
ncbi:MAG: radical SAM protein [Clostridia bacterium]|nr:radical SAM protein [Clostridia bacterium]